MNEIIPQMPVSIRAATMSDLPFIDALQEQHTQQVGWLPTTTLEGKIAAGHVLLAEGGGDPLGYVIGCDRYFKREDVGIIYQINVAPGKQRSFIGATLLKAMFDRAAYGCTLFCCWCAQDIEANRFWESMGFVPLAFRAGSERKSRVHIFWQKRIGAGDATTPYWFPSQTGGGSIREDRLVLPIPPGTHWTDAMPRVMPKEQSPAASRQLPGTAQRKPAEKKKAPMRVVLGAAMWFAPPAPSVDEKAKAAKPKREKRKNDPALIAAARELRDRWLEQVNAAGGPSLVLPSAKYDICRVMPVTVAVNLPALPVAA